MGKKRIEAEQSKAMNKEKEKGKGDKHPESGLDNKQSKTRADDKEHDEHGQNLHKKCQRQTSRCFSRYSRSAKKTRSAAGA